jgi:hypothetical protein
VSDRPQDADRTIIVTSLQGARRCVDCITAATSVPTARVARILKRAQRTVRLAERAAICSGCFRTMTVYGLGWWPKSARQA